MEILRARVTSKGQVTLPKPLRDYLNIQEGDQVEFAVDEDNHASLVKLQTPGSSAGILKHLAKKKPVSSTKMNEAIVHEAARKYRNKKRPS